MNFKCNNYCLIVWQIRSLLAAYSLHTHYILNAVCPSYNFVPSSSVDVRATYGSGRTCSVREDCAECIARRSPEATRCQQLYSLTFHPVS